MSYGYPAGRGRGVPINPYGPPPGGRGRGAPIHGAGNPQKQQDMDTLKQCFPKVDMETLAALYDDMGFEETYKGTQDH